MKKMKRLSTTILTVFAACSFTLLGAGIDGKWKGETKLREKSVAVSMDLKADGSTVTGSVSMGGRKAKPMEIFDGKIDGAEVTFKTKREGKKGSQTMEWKGTLAGDELKMTGSAGKKGRRSSEFTLKRASS